LSSLLDFVNFFMIKSHLSWSGVGPKGLFR
jgi:hypothetical protein